MENYITFHLHSDSSLLDSCTKFKDYVDRAVELGQTAIAFTEHGNIYNWTAKKMYCDKMGIKYIHGCEVYLTEKLFHIGADGEKYKIRDNYHTILLAKNEAGIREINKIVSLSSEPDHFYFKPRITFDEFLNISDNVIKTSACLASPLREDNLNKVEEKIQSEIAKVDLNIIGLSGEPEYESAIKQREDSILESLKDREVIIEAVCKHYDYFEVQPHINSEEQKEFNLYLYNLSKKYNKPLIAGTDTHSINKYKAECRSILLRSKKIEYTDEEKYDLTYKSYEELVDMFAQQGSLPEDIYLEAIENTNRMAEMIEDFTLDTSIKYPKMYEDDEQVLTDRVDRMFWDKVEKGVIPQSQVEKFKENIQEEMRVFKKVGMVGFLLSMSEIVCWCKTHGIPVGFNRGSCGGSCIAYITDIIDLNPVQWGTVFSRFCNEDRIEIGDKPIVTAA